MQTKLTDDRFYVEPKNFDEAKVLIIAMRKRLEEADKIIKKPDYEVVELLGKIDFSEPIQAKEELDKIIAELKGRPISERKPRRMALYVVPYHHGKSKTYERRKLTEDLSRKAELEKYAKKGTRREASIVYRTQFPEGLKDKGQNCQWPFEPDKLEIVEDT
ncbi:Uncharacterised protein [uncultured archaeon]|nr:Uncharacterised protein [uncultured archaeon]